MVSVASCQVCVSLPHEGLVFYWTYTASFNALPFHLICTKVAIWWWLVQIVTNSFLKLLTVNCEDVWEPYLLHERD